MRPSSNAVHDRRPERLLIPPVSIGFPNRNTPRRRDPRPGRRRRHSHRHAVRLAADALNPDALDRVYAAKGRPADMPLPVLVSSWAQALQVAVVSPDSESLARRLAEAYWPGSLTIVLPAAPGLPVRLTAGRDTVAVRMPDHPVPLALAERLGRPITGTSANRSGEPDITDPDELRRILASRVDGIIVSGPNPAGGPRAR